ncbi:IS66 family transposase [Phocaeicola vulgatus]|nr:IS66 family transposase [Phocaeicola vulgatus]
MTSSTRYPESCICLCWAHVRRNFVEAEGNDPPRARHALGQIGGLYAVEEKIRMEHLEGGGGGKASPGKIVPYYQRTGKMVQGGIWTYGR